jgi:hypothetical protein
MIVPPINTHSRQGVEGTNKLAGVVALRVLNSKTNENEAIPICVSVTQRSERHSDSIQEGDAARSASGVRQVYLRLGVQRSPGLRME